MLPIPNKNRVTFILYQIGIKKPMVTALNQKCQAALSALFVRVKCKTYWLEDIKGKIRFLLVVKIDVDNSIPRNTYQAIQDYVNQQVGTVGLPTGKSIQMTTVLYTKADRVKRSRHSTAVALRRAQELSGNSSFPSLLDSTNTVADLSSPELDADISEIEIEAGEFNQLFEIKRIDRKEERA
ncbi:hypothetical protein [Rhodoferax mekongensis]|uniref:hypothetical protein n=1 Tax=Rhodoferax mekongensis TaxID=3068341 RepID=UPI0028BE1727|nr:hypothetical protein [Rhodoferax sp. TBRC 17199]MDT7515380.1 hypothetical protein [Rhodoferax sp. TBRC 17199]